MTFAHFSMRSQISTSLLRAGFLSGFLAAAPLALADITVGPAGSGAQTDNLNDAIFNADEDETIYVFAGNYSNIRVIGKSVRIIGEGAELVTLAFSETATFAQSSRIEGLAAEQSAFVSGVTFDFAVNPAINAPVVLQGNRGPLYFHACDFRSSTGASSSTVSAFDCEDVTFDQCRIIGFQPEIQKNPVISTGGDGLYAEDSNLRLNACTIIAGDSIQSGLFFSQGGIGLELIDCTALLHNTSISGGDAQVSGASGTGTGSGIEAQTSAVTVTGAPGTTISGGSGGSDNPLITVAGSPAVNLLGSLSSLTTSASVTLAGGTNSDGTPVPDTVLNGSVATVELFQRPGLSPSVASGSPGTSFNLALDGEPGSSQLVALAFDTVAPYSLGGVSGQGLLDPAGVEFIGLLALDSGGAGSLAIDVPPLPSLVGTSGFFQGLQTGAGGGARVSLPTAFLVGL